MITKASECSVRQFMRALFEDDLSGFENFENIWEEYVDLSGLSQTMEKELMIGIHNIDVRRVVVPAMVEFQKTYMRQFGKPYIDGFWFFKKYGHRLNYEGNIHSFDDQLERVLTKEKRHFAEQEKMKKELADLRKNGVRIDGNSRKEFIKLLNAVGKSRRNDVDRDKTDVETYALMVKDYYETPQE